VLTRDGEEDGGVPKLGRMIRFIQRKTGERKRETEERTSCTSGSRDRCRTSCRPLPQEEGHQKPK
jgi:hypothetical protein